MANRPIYCDRTLCRLEMLNRAVQSYQKICIKLNRMDIVCLRKISYIYIYGRMPRLFKYRLRYLQIYIFLRLNFTMFF